MVFCFSDLHPSNFMIDTDGCTVVSDFADTSILPASFALQPACSNRLDFDIRARVNVPGASCDNVFAISEASRKIVFASSAFARMGRQVEGGVIAKHNKDRHSTGVLFVAILFINLAIFFSICYRYKRRERKVGALSSSCVGRLYFPKTYFAG